MASNTERLKDEIYISVTNLTNLRTIDYLFKDLIPDGIVITKKEQQSILTIINKRIEQCEGEVSKLWPKTL